MTLRSVSGAVGGELVCNVACIFKQMLALIIAAV